jgi:hypothetical protein
MSGQKYLPLNKYDGTLTGLVRYPAGPDDVASPGGLATIQHHWTRGMFGRPEYTTDVYAGTGDRYIYGEYGNLYRPNSHADINSFYRGPKSQATENTTINGDPYYWKNSGGTLGGQPTQSNRVDSPYIPFDVIANVPRNNKKREHFTYMNLGDGIKNFDSRQPLPENFDSFEMIDDRYEGDIPYGENSNFPPVDQTPFIGNSGPERGLLPHSQPPQPKFEGYSIGTPTNQPKTCGTKKGAILTTEFVDTPKKQTKIPDKKSEKKVPATEGFTKVNINSESPKTKSNKATIILGIIGIFTVVAFELWSKAILKSMREFVPGFRDEWYIYGFYAIIFSVFILFMIRQSNVTFSSCTV